MIHTPYKFFNNIEPAPGFYYDKPRADAILGWFENYLSFTSAKWMGKPFKFLPWQKMVLRPLYGFVDDQGLRQYQRVFIFVPKKNGKTELASGMGLFHLIGDSEQAPEVYAIASNVEQAKLCWTGADVMIQQSSELRQAQLESVTNPLRIRSPLNRGIFRVLSSTARGKQGLRPSAIICDEIHEWRGREIYDALTDPKATMTREQPLTIIITTAGMNENLANEIYAYGLSVQEQETIDNTFLPAIWSTDLADEEWDDIELAEKLNPAWSYTIKKDVVQQSINKAKVSELEEANYKMWTLNVFQRKDSKKWLSMPDWDKSTINTEQEKELMDHLFYSDDFPVYAGLDFAPKRDLNSISLVVRDPETNFVYLKHHSWITQLESDRQTKASAVPFNKWGDQGYLTILPDKVIEPEQIGEYLVMTLLIYSNIISMAYDAYRIGTVIDKLVENGLITIPAVDIPNTTRSLNEASQILSDLILTHKLRHLNDPLLRYCADNVTCKVDHAGLIKPDKSSVVQKIDPMVAGIYALDCMIREESKGDKKIIPIRSVPKPTMMHNIANKIGAGAS